MMHSTRIAPAFLIAALLLSPPVLAEADLATVPERFVGHWAGSPGSCGAIADDRVLRVSAHHIAYWESEGPIRAVVVHGANEVALIMELWGEGETWLSTAQFTLSEDGDRLIDSRSVPGEDLVRYRCDGSP